MKKLLALFLFTLSASSQTLTVYPSNVTLVRGGYQTISAVVEDATDRTVTWSTSGGTLSTASCTDALTAPCTTSLHTTTPGTYTVTATSNANHAVVKTATVTFTNAPTPVTVHPRLYFTPSNVAALQSKAVSGNVVWTALQSAAATSAAIDDAAWSTGSGGGGYTCDGGTGLPNSTYIAEEQSWIHSPELDAYAYALLANADPSSTNRARWACRAHDLYLYSMKSILGTIPGDTTGCACFDNPTFLLGNRGSSWGAAVGLTKDWIDSTFSSGDRTTIIAAMTKYISEITVNTTIADNHPVPIGDEQSATLVTAANSYGYMRTSGNNYALGRTAELVAMGLSVDASEDPSTAHCSGGYDKICTDGVPNSVRAAFHYGIGTYLFLQYLNFEDPNVATTALNAASGLTLSPTDACNANQYGNTTPLTANMPCYGGGRGGLSMEGNLYLGWLIHLRAVALMLHTSGNDDPTNYPQISFATSSWWDLHLQGMLHMMTPALYSTNQQLFFAYGPVNSMYDQQSFLQQPIWTIIAYDNIDGRTDRQAELGWMATHIETNYNLTSQVAQYIPVGVDLFLAGGTGANPFGTPSDPRPTMPTSYYSYNSGQLVSSTGSWSSTTGSVFRAYCPRYPQPDHEEGYCSTFDFYMNGDWVSKGLSGYALNDQSGYRAEELPDYSNNSGYGNTPSLLPNPTNQYYIDPFANRGGQYSHGWGTGEDTNNRWSDTSAFTYSFYDMKGNRNLFGPGAGGIGLVSMQDMTGATRDFLWLKPHYLVVYDRGDTGTASFKRQWFTATGTPTISGTDISWPSSLNKTSNYLHVLLQPNANIATYGLYPFMTSQANSDYAPANRIVIDSGSINHATELFHSTSITPAHQVNFLADKGVTGSCGSLTQVSTTATPGSCQYNVDVTGVYTVSSGDAASGVTIHYDWSTPATSMRSLNVMEAQNFGTAASGASLNQSVSGQGFDCAYTAGETVMACFMRTIGTFTGTTYHALGAVSHYVADLTPNTTYTISASGAPASATTNPAGLLAFASDGTGDVTISTGGTPTASAPTFSPVAGSYTGAQAVTISSTSSGAIKCYNFTGSPATNGTTGCATGSTLYSGPVTVSSSSTLYAVAGGTGWLDSPVGSAAYTITSPAAATPTCTPPAGSYTGTQTVTCSSVTPSSTTYCTVDGSTPTTSSPVCTGISVAASLTLKAISAASGFTNSAVLTQGYTITPPAGTPQVTTTNATISGTVVIQ